MVPAIPPASTPDSRVPSPSIKEDDPQSPPPTAPMANEIRPVDKAEKSLAKSPDDDEKVDVEPGKLGSKEAQEKDIVALKEIVSQPARYLDHVVYPAELVTVDTRLVPGRRERRGLSVKNREGSYENARDSGTPFEIVIKPELATNLGDQLTRRNLVYGEYPALIKMKVMKDPARPNVFLGVVEWMEFLIYTNPVPISFTSRHYNKAFRVITITDQGSQVGLSSAYDEWRKRIGSKFLANLRIRYENAYKINRNNEFSKMENEVAKDAAAKSKILQQQQSDMIRSVWGGR
jgi:hypothetical protein